MPHRMLRACSSRQPIDGRRLWVSVQASLAKGRSLPNPRATQREPRMKDKAIRFVLPLAGLGFALVIRGDALAAEEAGKPGGPSPMSAKEPAGWKSLFDGKRLGDWKPADYTGAGKVYVRDGTVVLEKGNQM